jgi:outer membrane lipoprotein-sorting protein
LNRKLLHLIVLVACMLLFVSGCGKSSGSPNATNSATAPALDVSATPPYPTREPDTYQARYVTSLDLGGAASPLSAAISAMKKEIFVARDGAQRRQDFELVPGIKTSYLQTSQGQFVLLPAKRIYAALDSQPNSLPPEASTGFSPDRLMNERVEGSRYEKLGVENVGGRTTTKYRLTSAPLGGGEHQSQSETVIWVDESLQMPVKWEMTSKSKSGDQSRYTVVVEDIQQTVSGDVFQIPADFKKVDYKELRAQAFGASPPEGSSGASPSSQP